MSKDWTISNLGHIFDLTNYQKWLCAMHGYAYVGTVYEEVYKYLNVDGHFVRALDDRYLGDRVKEKIVQNIGVAYLNNFDKLLDQKSLIYTLIQRAKREELSQLIWFMWTLRREGDERTKNKIFELWPAILGAIDMVTPLYFRTAGISYLRPVSP
jgi:hypothetical protein